MFERKRRIRQLGLAVFLSVTVLRAAEVTEADANFDGSAATNPATAAVLDAGTSLGTWSNVSKTSGGTLAATAYSSSGNFLFMDSGGKNANFTATATLNLPAPKAVDGSLKVSFKSLLSRYNTTGSGWATVEGYGGTGGTEKLFKLYFRISMSNSSQIGYMNASDTYVSTGSYMKFLGASKTVADDSHFTNFDLFLKPGGFDLSLTNAGAPGANTTDGPDNFLSDLPYNTSSPATTLSKIVFSAVTGSSGNYVSGMRIDDIKVLSGASAPPVALPGSNLTLSAFTANWTSVSNADSYTLEYADNTAFTGSTTQTGINSTSSVVSKSSNVTYYYRVAAVKGGLTGSYSTAVSVSPYIAHKDLEGGETESFDNGIPTEWAVINVDGGDAWISGSPANASYRPADADGSYVSCAFDKPNNDWLVTHKLSIPSEGAKLSFKGYHGYRTGSSGAEARRRFKVKLAVDTGSNQQTVADYQDVFSFNGIHPNTDFQNFEVDIIGDAYKGKDVYIAFVYDANDGRALSIDDVKLAPTLTPAIGLDVSLTDTELVWTVENEIDVKEYRVVDAQTGEVYEVVIAVDADGYSVTVPEGVDVKLIVVDNSGFSDTYLPEDGSVKIEVYDLEKGWNLIAVTSDHADLEKLKDETVGVIWGWNGTGYKVVETAKATDAVWVHAPTAKQVYVSGSKSDAVINLNLGWNLVGPVENDYIPAAADTVYSWSKVYDVIAGDSKVLVGGRGYWIFSL